MLDESKFLTVAEVAKRAGVPHVQTLTTLAREGYFPTPVFRVLEEGKRPRLCYPVEIAEAAIAAWLAKNEAKRRLKALAQLTAAPAA